MAQLERDGKVLTREVLVTLDVKSIDREPILNDDLVARIGGILSDAKITSHDHIILKQWHIVTPDGKSLDLCAYPTRRGRVISADVLAHDTIRISYKKRGETKTCYMLGISEIGLLKDDNGTTSVEFIQKTDKKTNIIEVSDSGVDISDAGYGRNIPFRFIRNFLFY